MRPHPVHLLIRPFLLIAMFAAIAPDAPAKGALNAVEYKSTAGLVSQYATYVPEGSDKGDHGLLVAFHADGAASAYDRVALELGPVAAESKLITLSIRSPSGRNWHDNAAVHSNYVQALLQEEIFKKLKIDQKRVYFVGKSGGAVFLNGMFVPLFAHLYQGGAIMLCGGVRNLMSAGIAEVFNFGDDGGTKFKSRFKFFYKVNKDDYIYPQSVEGMEQLTRLGFSVTRDEPASGGHCGFDAKEALKAGLAAIAAK